MTTASQGAAEKKKLTQYMTNTVVPHAIRTRTLKNPNERLVEAGGEEDHLPHPQTLKHPTSPTDVGIPTKPDQRLVEAGREDDHRCPPKTLKHPTSSTDVGTPTKPDIPTIFIKSRHDDGPISSKPFHESNPDDLIGRTFPTTPWRQWGEVKS